MPTLPKLIKYMDIERLGHDENFGIFSAKEDVVLIEEKIDGGNAQFRLWEGGILFGTRNNHFQIGDDSGQNKQFGANAEWVREKLFGNGVGAEKTASDLLNPDYVYYGEWCKKHTIPYKWEEMPKFIGFDILNLVSGVFLPYTAMKSEYDRLGLPIVPMLYYGPLVDLDVARLENFIGKSAFYEGTMEGIVVKNYFRKNVYGRQMFAKLVTQQFKEANMAAFGGVGQVKPVQDDTVKFIEAFCTEARIKKAIFRIIDEGEFSLGRPLMAHLPKAVIEDIFKEESWTMMKELESVNFDLLRKMVPKVCLRLLDQMLSERALQAAENKTNIPF